jgi:hypothetical protein
LLLSFVTFPFQSNIQDSAQNCVIHTSQNMQSTVFIQSFCSLNKILLSSLKKHEGRKCCIWYKVFSFVAYYIPKFLSETFFWISKYLKSCNPFHNSGLKIMHLRLLKHLC